MHIPSLHRRLSALSWIILLKVVMVLAPIGLMFSLLNDHFFITPTLNYRYLPGHRAHVITPKTPAQLLKSADPNLRWRVSVDNFLFSVTIPRLIEAVRVRVRLHPGTQQYVTLDSVGKKGVNTSTIISASVLNKLEWKHVSDKNFTLWMRDKHVDVAQVTEGSGKNAKTRTVTSERAVAQYDSVAAFTAAPPDLRTVGLVGIDRMTFATVANYQPSTTEVSLGHTLRGSHQFYIYAANETLKFSFDKIDLNRSVGTDGVTVRVARVDELKSSNRTWLKTVTVGDDGISGKTGPRGQAQTVSIEIPNAQPGVYFVDISTSEDVLLANMRSLQHDLSFTGRVFLSEGPAYAEANFVPVSLRTNGDSLTFAANHDQGKQEILVATKKYGIQDVKVDHVIRDLQGITSVSFAKGDMIVSSDGLMAFQGFDLLADGARALDIAIPDPDFSSFDYVLADYHPQAADLLEVEQTFRIDDIALSGKTMTLSINSPGLVSSGSTLGLKDLHVTMIRGPFPWGKLWQKLGLKK